MLWLRPIVQQDIHSRASAISLPRADVRLGETGDACDDVRRISGEEAGHRVPALGVFGDEVGIDVATLDKQVEYSVEQGQVGAGFDREIQVGPVGGGGASPAARRRRAIACSPSRHWPCTAASWTRCARS